jgi:hypothetical protein
LWTTAAGAAETWNLESLTQMLSDLPAPRRQYTETRESAFLQVPLISRGMIQLLPDGTLVKQKDTPYFERLSVDRTQVTVEGDGFASRSFPLTDLPAIYSFTEGLRALLSGDLGTLDELFVSEMTGNRGSWRLTLEPREKQAAKAIERILVTGDAATITRLHIWETDGDSTLLELDQPP